MKKWKIPIIEWEKGKKYMDYQGTKTTQAIVLFQFPNTISYLKIFQWNNMTVLPTPT